VHRRRVFHVAEAAAVTAEVVVVTPRRQARQRVRRPEHRQSHRGPRLYGGNTVRASAPVKKPAADLASDDKR